MHCQACGLEIPAQSRFCMHCGQAQPTPPEALAASGLLTEPVTGMELLPVTGGSFRMGNIWEDGGLDEKPTHLVEVAPFHLGRTPVTQGQWRQVMGNNPAADSGELFVGDAKPVVNVSWDEGREFIRRLNELSREHYRLPSEAEWEYAARSGGLEQKWAGTSSDKIVDDFVWHSGNSEGRLQPVGRKKPNDLGLHDMSGNIWEWCEDIWHPNYENAPRDAGPWLEQAGGKFPPRRRVLRGGSWNFNIRNARTTYRDWNNSDYRFFVIGLRLAR
ncbi:SUMF1/EgtB/PvdO family nonheme iron enzyme [Desulfurivibrio sp. D14AmB]|uniref:SUMF1/EgtB/PvdO family nonheme iron enzyme n=1 Tax=Desulfurivibrio sp. D14AmB TaxID=3374370 RepID=UPI00376F2B6D